jgi:hypothetical protein
MNKTAAGPRLGPTPRVTDRQGAQQAQCTAHQFHGTLLLSLKTGTLPLLLLSMRLQCSLPPNKGVCTRAMP